MDKDLRSALAARSFWFHKFEFVYHRVTKRFKKVANPLHFFLSTWTRNQPACNWYFGRSFWYDATTDIGTQLFFQGGFEMPELEMCEQLINATDTIIDIGANIGYHSIHFAHWAPQGQVHAIEPSKSTAALLRRNVEGIGNIHIHETGISNRDGESDFFLATDNAYSGFKDTGNKPITGSVKVVHRTLESFVQKEGIDRINFIKVDVEGHEREVIEGMITTLQRFKPVLFVEISPLENQSENPKETFRMILDSGYEAFVLRNGQLSNVDRHQPDRHNYFFIPNDNPLS